MNMTTEPNITAEMIEAVATEIWRVHNYLPEETPSRVIAYDAISAALAVQPREWIDPKNWPDATSVPVKESLTTQRAATCQESLQAQSANSPEIPDGWKDAEIARLRDALQGIADCAMSGSIFEELALDALFADPTKDK
jgi:hypothetical protein